MNNMEIEDEIPPFAWGICRACGKRGNCSTDDGYCGGCN